MHVRKHNGSQVNKQERHRLTEETMQLLHLLDEFDTKEHTWATEVGDYDLATQSFDYDIQAQILLNRIFVLKNKVSVYLDHVPLTTTRFEFTKNCRGKFRVHGKPRFHFSKLQKKVVVLSFQIAEGQEQLENLLRGPESTRTALKQEIDVDGSLHRIVLERALYTRLRASIDYDYSSNEYRDDESRDSIFRLADALIQFGWSHRQIAKELNVSKDYLRTHLPDWRRNHD